MKYGQYWDAFYEKTYVKEARKALWDVPAALSVGKDLEIFQSYFHPELPVLDIGCGTGEQAHYLSAYYPRVIGVDAAPTAVALAAAEHTLANLEFQTLDAADPEACAALHQKYGDMNLYMRGVMHQVDAAEQARFVANLSLLMGERGRLYFIEVADNIRSYFAEATHGFHELPKAVQEVFVSNLPPHGINLEHLPRLFPAPGFNILASGEGHLLTNLTLPRGEAVRIPAVYALIAKGA
ncbi:MAG: class I SAM-dependent methyltransferase [Lewinellaceae bacterium]|nr:class I SAM-dependent methyltransferase [Lewinellaceae bacterium]